MPEAADGHVSATNFDFYDDSESLISIGAKSTTPPAPILPPPRLQELRGQKMGQKPPLKKLTQPVASVRQSTRGKRKPPVQALRPLRKSKKARVVRSSDDDEGEDRDHEPAPPANDDSEDEDPSGRLEELHSMSAKDI